MNRRPKLACVLLACIAAASASAKDPAKVTLVKDLSQGLRLHAVDGQRVWPTQGRRIEVSPGVHTLEVRYAFDFQRDQDGGFVEAYAFECDFSGAGPYTLRSIDSRVVERVPTLWIEADGQATPRCRAL